MENQAFEDPDKVKEISKKDADNGSDKNFAHMKRQIGLIGGVAMIVGTTMGTGIFISPAGLLKRTDSVAMSLVVWAACGVLSTFAALVYCELGTVVPRSGAEHAYYMAAFKPLHPFWGEIPAFLFAFMKMTLLKPSSLAIISLTFGRYAMTPFINEFDICKDWQQNSYDYELARKLLAVSCASFIGCVNIFSTVLATRFQIVFTVTKLMAVALVVGIGIYNVSVGQNEGFPDGFDTGDAGAGSIALAFYQGLWAYEGWNSLNFLTEELKNPAVNLPRAIFIGLPILTGCYILANLAYLTSLSKAELIGSDAVAIDFGDKRLGVMSFLIPLFVAFSTIGTSNGAQYTAGRISYVAGREGHTVDFLAYIQANRLTPVNAIIFNVLMCTIMVFISDINELINFFSFATWIFYGFSMAALIVLRKTQPDAVRPFRVPILIPWAALIASIFLVLAPIIDEPTPEYLYVLGFSVLGLILYYPFVYKKYQPKFMFGLTRFIQNLTLAVPSPYKKD